MRENEAVQFPRQVHSSPLAGNAQLRVNSRTMPMPALKSLIEARLKELGISSQAAALRVSDNRDLVRNVLRQGDDANPRADTLALVARALELPVEQLVQAAAPLTTSAKAPRHEFVVAPHALPPVSSMPKDVPVWGTAMGSLVDGVEGVHMFSGEPVDYVRRPPALMNARDAYAFYVSGDSMDPVHPHGALRFAQPYKPVNPGDTVVVLTRNWDDDPGQGYIKILRRRTGEFLILEQLNPRATIQIPVRHVVSVHKVPDLNDLFGV